MRTVMVAVVGVTPDHGIYQCYATETGIDRAYIGPKFTRPRDAYLFADREDRKHLNPSPLRPAEGGTHHSSHHESAGPALSEQAERSASVVSHGR